jgi:hypothetical protein
MKYAPLPAGLVQKLLRQVGPTTLPGYRMAAKGGRSERWGADTNPGHRSPTLHMETH